MVSVKIRNHNHWHKTKGKQDKKEFPTQPHTHPPLDTLREGSGWRKPKADLEPVSSLT